MSPAAWNRGYERAARFYDAFDRKPNIEFFARRAAQVRHILDVGAGTGRIAMPLARRGTHVVCVEPSPAMRAECERKRAEEGDVGARITVVAADAGSFRIDRTFPLAILSGTFDHFLDDDERRRVLSNVGRHLEPGGALVFDVFLGFMGDSPRTPAGVHRTGNEECRRFVSGRILPGGVRETVLEYEIREGDRLLACIQERSLVGITDRAHIHELLAECEFAVRREWSSYDEEPYREGASLLILEAQRP